MIRKFNIMSDNIILIDWLAFTYKKENITPYQIIDSLGFKERLLFERRPGRYRYLDCLSFGHINLYYNNLSPDADYPMLELTGQGCREFTTYSTKKLEDLLELCRDDVLYGITRLDIAYDDTHDILNSRQILEDYRADNWVSHSCGGYFHGQVKRKNGKLIEGDTIQTGSKSSEMYMRIYDKAFERGFDDDRHWVRCELVLKHDRAFEFIKDPEILGKKFRGVIHNYFRFVTPSKKDSNKRRWKMRPYWAEFLDDAEKISVYTAKDIDYNLSRLSKYVFDQAGNSIDTYIKCVGLVKFLDDLIKRHGKLTPKQKYLIEQCKLLVNEEKPVDERVLEELSYNFKA